MLRGLAEEAKGIRGLAGLAARIQAEKELKLDMIASTDAMEMYLDEDKTPSLGVSNHGAYPVLKTASDQIRGYCDIPSKYWDKMQREDPHLLTANVNAWFWNTPKKRMLRTLGGDARAFLSSRYNRIDHVDVSEVALPVLNEVPDLMVTSCDITERKMYIQVVAPRIQGEVAKGDVVQAGVSISNSDIGEGSISVSSLFWRLRCLNGMVGVDKCRAMHVGRDQDNEDLWRDDTKAAEDRSILLKVRDMVKAALDQTRFAKTLGKMQGLADMQLSGDPVAAVEVLAQKVNATETEQTSILNALIKGGDISAWGFVNAVTAQAHTAQNYDRAVEFETAGGQLLELPESEWQRVLIGA